MIRWVVRLAVGNPVLVNLLFVVVVLLGSIAWVRMPKEEFPQVRTDRIAVVLVYPGASPRDIEEQIVRPVEDAVDGIDGIKHVFADALEGRALIDLELVRGTDAEATRDEVQQSIDDIGELPDGIVQTTVTVAQLRIPLVHVGLAGDTRQRVLADELAAEIAAIDGVGEVQIYGADERRVRVTPDMAAMAARRLSADTLVRVIRAAGAGAPAGVVEVDGLDVLVRTQRGVFDPEDLQDVPVMVGDGRDLRVGDVASVRQEWAEPEITHRVNGQPAIILRVMRQPGADALAVVPEVYAWAEQRAGSLPAGLQLHAYDDSARMVAARLRVLASNGLVGALLVSMVLVMFIGWRNTALVVWGMPVAYGGALAAMYLNGTTISVVSTFALLLVIGIIVDDAIVIVENVQRHLELGKDRVQAALDGTSEVFGAVLSATITTCLAFGTLYSMDGVMGQVMQIVPTVVILSLAASLVEAFFVLPGHLAHYAEERRDVRENLPTRALKRAYEPIVRWATRPRWRGVVLIAMGALLAGIFGLTTIMRRSLNTPGNPVFAFVNIDMPASSGTEATRVVLRDLEQIIEAASGDALLYMDGRVGEQLDPSDFPTWGPRYAQLKVGFLNRPDVMDRVPSILDEVRSHLEGRTDLDGFSVKTMQGGPPAGKPIDVRVRSRQASDVDVLVAGMAGHLASRPGVFDVRTESEPGTASFEVVLDQARAARFGVREATLAAAIRQSLEGELALEFPVAERTTEVLVGQARANSLDAVGDLPVSLPDGRTIRVRQVAKVQRQYGAGKLHRVDGQRAVRVYADLDGFQTSGDAERIEMDRHFEELAKGYPDASLFYGGELADVAASFRNVPWAILLSGAMIYVVLAVQFRSYVQPVVIIAAVPLGLAGAILGLFVLRMDLSFLATIGSVALTGIVVNDSLVLVDFINRRRREGVLLREAVISASLTRLRPILITTVTTVFGLLPLAIGLAGEEPLLAPMAVSISFGLAFATALTIVVVPVLYLVVDDVAVGLGRRLGWPMGDADHPGPSADASTVET